MRRVDILQWNGFSLVASLVAAGLFSASTLLPWWGLDISGNGLLYSFRWTMWSGSLVAFPSTGQYAWVNYLDQVLSLGTTIVGTFAIVSAVLAFLSMNLGRTRLPILNLILSIAVPLLYVEVVFEAIGATWRVWPAVGCLTYPPALAGMCINEGAVETWGFQTGYYVYLAGVLIAAFGLLFARVHQRLSKRVDRGSRGFPTAQVE